MESIKKTQRETTLEIENLGNRSEVIDISITNRIKEIKDRISEAEDTIKNIDTIVKENAKCKKLLTQNNPENPAYDEKTKPKDNKYTIEQNFPTQRASKYLQQNYRRKFP